MSTIIFKCDCCKITFFGDKDRNYVRPHLITKGHGEMKNVKFIDGYYICDNCLEYDRKKYMEV